tara:strand:+ start:76 stop:915 length:840 start_codon:yes stop_codon:yes gene_type:complete
VITIYVAIAGCCAEDEANAGGGSSPPSGLTPPNSIYLALSNGGNVGVTTEVFGSNMMEFFMNGLGPQNLTPFSGKAGAPSTMTIVDITNPSLNGGFHTIQLTNTMTAIAFNSIFNSGYNGALGATHLDFAQFLIGWYLESPNGSFTISSYDIISCNTTMTGFGAFWSGDPNSFFPTSFTGDLFPLQDSTSFNNAANVIVPLAPTTVAGSIGANGTKTSSGNIGTNTGTMSVIQLRNFAPRSGGVASAQAGEYFSTVYRVICSVGGNQERTFVEHRILLT